VITTDREVTTSWGGSFSLDKQSFLRQTILLGGDFYRDSVVAPSFNLDPQTRRVTIVRPRVPNGARHWLAGLFFQDAIELLPNRLRLSGALRYNLSAYRARAINSLSSRMMPCAWPTGRAVWGASGQSPPVSTWPFNTVVASGLPTSLL
jgi:hypothetical protein